MQQKKKGANSLKQTTPTSFLQTLDPSESHIAKIQTCIDDAQICKRLVNLLMYVVVKVDKGDDVRKVQEEMKEANNKKG
jgi:hypothetical protein